MGIIRLLRKVKSRLRVILLLKKHNHCLIYKGGYPTISSKAQISTAKGTITLGVGTTIWSNTLLAVSGGDIEVGRGVLFNSNCNIVSKQKIEIGEYSVFGPNVCIFDHNHRFDQLGVKDEYKTDTIHIGKKCWVGAGTIILKGSDIGDGCIIGAGCVIQGAIPAHSVVVSNREVSITPVK